MNKQEIINNLENTKSFIADCLSKAKREGIAQVEIYAAYHTGMDISLEKNDLNTSTFSEETNYGIRVIENHCQGFVTTNDKASIYDSILDARSLAKTQNTPDEAMELPETSPQIHEIDGLYHEDIDSLDIEDLVSVVSQILNWRKEKYPKISIDSGDVSFGKGYKLIANTKGLMVSELRASVSAGYMGMAIDGEDIGSFDYDSAIGRNMDSFQKSLTHSLEDFGSKCMGALKAQTIKGFKGNILIPPDSVFSFLGDLLSSLTATQIRKKRSKFGDMLNKEVTSPLLSIYEDPHIPCFQGSSAFDREGVSTKEKEIIQKGVLKTFFYNHFEARKAGLDRSNGSALGGSSSVPYCGPGQLQVMPGTSSLSELLNAKTKTILVNRFSGSSNSSSGDFSGSVKGGQLLENGNKYPIKETIITGNIYNILKQIVAVSHERKLLYSSSQVPWILIEGVDITGTDEG